MLMVTDHVAEQVIKKPGSAVSQPWCVEVLILVSHAILWIQVTRGHFLGILVLKACPVFRIEFLILGLFAVEPGPGPGFLLNQGGVRAPVFKVGCVGIVFGGAVSTDGGGAKPPVPQLGRRIT